MFYQSTRNNKETVSPSLAILKGIADDGGLYMLKSFEDIDFDWKKTLDMTTFQIAEYVLCTLLPDYSSEEMETLVKNAYTGKFEDDELTPTVKVGDKYILELFRGPTSAFKDVALSMLPQLLNAAKKKNGVSDEIMILTATSGDTGKAALEGFHDVDGVSIIVFYPENGVSAVQKAQMVTQVGSNVKVCAVRGNFDDAQTGVKKIFSAVTDEKLLDGKGVRLSSANSINIGRLAPQLVYYFKSYADLVKFGEIKAGDLVDFVVPTGNFGDILAGYFAKKLGLPIGKFVCASNANNILTDFINTGVYDKKRPFNKTISPSMDILVSSNLERLLYLLCDCNAEEVSGYMKSLSDNGEYTVSDKIRNAIQKEFCAGFCDDNETYATIKSVYDKYGYLCDPHTAVAWNVAEKYSATNGSSNKQIVLSTASPYKFCTAVEKALGSETGSDEFEVMKALNNRTGIDIPASLAKLETMEQIHFDVTDSDKMLQYVLDVISKLNK